MTMNADDAWVWLSAILVVWFVLGAALADLLQDAGNEPAASPVEGWPDARDGVSAGMVAKRGLNRQAPALPWRRCIRWPKARRRISHANRLHR
jgi:hypothetical protein